MVANSFGNRNFMQPMRKLRVPYFFPFGFWGGGILLFFVCSHRSQSVASVFLTTPQFVLSLIVWLCFNFHVHI
jgi:hypothetical protein